jgi:hypothetical protein
VTTGDSFLSMDDARHIFISNRNVTKATEENLDAQNMRSFNLGKVHVKIFMQPVFQ